MRMPANQREAVPSRLFAAVLWFALRLAAQSPNEALEWSVALGGRFRQMQDPVVAAYALASRPPTTPRAARAGGASIRG